MLLIDASVWLAALDKDDRFYQSARELVTAGGELAALDLTLHEVANVVVRRFNSAAATAAASGVLLACKHFARVDIDMISAAAEIAAEYGLTTYDASYVETARRYDWTLVSVDVKDLVSRGLALLPDDPAVLS